MSDDQLGHEPAPASEPEQVKQTAVIRAVRWALAVDPAECQTKANRLLRKYSDGEGGDRARQRSAGGGDKTGGPSDRELRRKIAEKIVAEYAKKGAVAGFATGMPANIAASMSLAVVDTGTLLHFYSKINAMVGYLANPHYYQEDGWQDDILVILAGASQVLREIAIEGSKHTAKTLIKQYVRKGALKALQRWILKWFGKKVTQRALIAKTIPIVGGGIGGTWNYLEVKVIGNRIIKYHFDDLLD